MKTENTNKRAKENRAIKKRSGSNTGTLFELFFKKLHRIDGSTVYDYLKGEMRTGGKSR